LGGTSLEILKLTRRLNNALESRRALTTVLQYPTVASWRCVSRRESTHRVRTTIPLFPLQLTGRKVPLFCIHPGMVGVLVFVNLAKYFAGERPFVALRARGFNEGEGWFTSFDESSIPTTGQFGMAASGPVRHKWILAGRAYCFEIARGWKHVASALAFLVVH